MPYSIKLCLTLGGSLGALVMQTESKAEEAGLGGVSSLHFTVYPPLSEHLEGGRWAPLNYLPRKEVRRTNPVLMCSQAKWHVLFPPPTDLSCALLPWAGTGILTQHNKLIAQPLHLFRRYIPSIACQLSWYKLDPISPHLDTALDAKVQKSGSGPGQFDFLDLWLRTFSSLGFSISKMITLPLPMRSGVAIFSKLSISVTAWIIPVFSLGP